MKQKVSGFFREIEGTAPHMDSVGREIRDEKKVPDFGWFLQRLESEMPDLRLEEQIVREAAETIWRKIHYSLDVNTIVKEVPTSRRTLERYFREQIGLTICEVIAFAKLELAKWLLIETSLPIHDVATQAGYASSDWMGKVIRRTLGMTPNDYRRNARERGNKK